MLGGAVVGGGLVGSTVGTGEVGESGASVGSLGGVVGLGVVEAWGTVVVGSVPRPELVAGSGSGGSHTTESTGGAVGSAVDTGDGCGVAVGAEAGGSSPDSPPSEGVIAVHDGSVPSAGPEFPTPISAATEVPSDDGNGHGVDVVDDAGDEGSCDPCPAAALEFLRCSETGCSTGAMVAVATGWSGGAPREITFAARVDAKRGSRKRSSPASASSTICTHRRIDIAFMDGALEYGGAGNRRGAPSMPLAPTSISAVGGFPRGLVEFGRHSSRRRGRCDRFL